MVGPWEVKLTLNSANRVVNTFSTAKSKKGPGRCAIIYRTDFNLATTVFPVKPDTSRHKLAFTTNETLNHTR